MCGGGGGGRGGGHLNLTPLTNWCYQNNTILFQTVSKPEIMQCAFSEGAAFHEIGFSLLKW